MDKTVDRNQATNPMGWHVFEDNDFSLIRKLEQKFKCSGMCGVDPPLFYTT